EGLSPARDLSNQGPATDLPQPLFQTRQNAVIDWLHVDSAPCFSDQPAPGQDVAPGVKCLSRRQCPTSSPEKGRLPADDRIAPVRPSRLRASRRRGSRKSYCHDGPCDRPAPWATPAQRTGHCEIWSCRADQADCCEGGRPSDS